MSATMKNGNSSVALGTAHLITLFEKRGGAGNATACTKKLFKLFCARSCAARPAPQKKSST